MSPSECIVYRLGQVPYELAWRLQDHLAQEVARGRQPPTLLLLEHPHTYTIGRRGRNENLLWDETERQRRGVELFWVDRGGDITYHGPGQLVGYPILPIGNGKVVSDPDNGRSRLPHGDYPAYLRGLEKALIQALARLGVVSGQVPGLTGVWVQNHVPSRCANCLMEERQPPAKIAAIGVKIDARGISRHGFALNVDPDMSYWEGIIGCGLAEHPVTSLADLLQPTPPMAQVMDAVAGAFGESFGYTMVELLSPVGGRESAILEETLCLPSQERVR